MEIQQKKSSGITPQTAEMTTPRTLRCHPYPQVHPANLNVLTSVMETKQVHESATHQNQVCSQCGIFTSGRSARLVRATGRSAVKTGSAGSGVASPKIWEGPEKLGGRMLDFMQITLFCFGYRLLKHKMTICSENL